MSKTNQALIVIDVQMGLFQRANPVYQAEQVLDNINILIDRARQAGVPVIFIQHSNDNTLMKGSAQWKLHPEIRPLAGEKIVYKLHPNAFIDTDFQDELEKSDVGELIVTGLLTNGCVRATSLGALELGYKVVLVTDGHSTFSKPASKIIKKLNTAINEEGAMLKATQEVEFI